MFRSTLSVCRVELFLNRFEFSNHLQVFWPTARPLNLDQPVQTKAQTLPAGDIHFDGIREQIFAGTAACDFTQQIKRSKPGVAVRESPSLFGFFPSAPEFFCELLEFH
jgi:hypothetical protein